MPISLLAAVLALTSMPQTADISPAQIAVAKATLESGLRDYQESRFRGFREVRSGPVLALCGEANLRNGAGGLTGWNPLAVIIEGDPLGPRLIGVKNGYEGLADFVKVCIMKAHNPAAGDRDVGPKGAIEGTVDLTPQLQPVAE